MLSAALLIATSLQAQTPAPTPPTPPAPRAAPASEPAAAPASAEERAVAAAERAAAAAERAAEASARAAEAAERAATAAAPPAPGAAAPAEPAAAAPAPKKDVWDVTLGAGLISLTGNASTFTFSGLASAQRKTDRWIYAFKAFSSYGRSRPPELEGEESLSQVVALNAGAELRGDRRFTQVLSGYVQIGAETDHVKSVESRSFGESGLGVLWWDEKSPEGRQSYLRTDAAFRYAYETRFQYYPTRLDLEDVDLGGPRFGVVFRYGLNERVLFKEDVEVLISVIGDSRVLVNSQTQLSVGLTEALSLGASFLVKSDSAPPAGKESTDTALALNLEVKL